MMKFVVILCLAVVAVHSADVEFRTKNRNAQQAYPQQVKRQATVANGRQSVSSSSFRAQQAPLQQPYRPSASLRSGAQNSGAQAAQTAGFAPSAPADQLFVPLRDAAEAPVRARQGPSRPAAPLAASGRTPEYVGGFPEGFTSGLPAFDFQGRMPEPDAKSDGFMDGVLNNFPNLKSFGGFDPLPDLGREDSETLAIQPPKRSSFAAGSGRSSAGRPAQRHRREAVESNVTISSRAVVVDGDEAMLEPDEPAAEKKSNRSARKMPTDIQDIIADLKSTDVETVGEEQRFSPTFFPTNGPYGRFPAPAAAPAAVPTGRARRPVGPPIPQKTRYLQRSPYADQIDFVDDNSLLGSGNFDVLGGGYFRDSGDYRPQYNYYGPPAYSPPARPAYYPAHNPSPPSYEFQPIPAPPQHNNDNYQTSFFDDDFFSNFRDFADVNQDYRN